ncbi:MAG: hypothetical protein IPK52_14815 [Chloroflexi bacterium]|nr:hypothetical protein [Chloroflexota bacterium]
MYGSDEEMYAYRRIVGGGRVDGMIVARARRNDPRIAYLKALDFPFAVSGSGGEDDPSDFPTSMSTIRTVSSRPRTTSLISAIALSA